MHVLLPTPVGMGLYMSFNTIGWLVVTLLISISIWHIAQRKEIILDQFAITMLLALICLTIPFFYGDEHAELATPRLLAVFGGVLLWLALNQIFPSQRKLDNVLILIVAAIAIQGTFGLVQFLFFEQGDWLGYDPTRHRPHGSLVQPNVAGSFQATGILLSCFLISRKKQPLIYESILWSCLIISPFILTLLQSRVGFLGSIVGLTLVSWYMFAQHKKRAAIVLVVITCSFVSGYFALQHSSTVKREAEVYSNAGERIDIYKVSLAMIAAKPLTGYGYGNFERAYLDFHNQMKREDPALADPILRLSHPHNEVLFWVIEGGILPLLAFIILLIGFYRLLSKVHNWPLKLALLGVITPIVLHSQTGWPFYLSLSHWIALILLMWYIKQQSKDCNFSFQLNAAFLLKSFSLTTVALAVPFFVTTLHTNLIISAFEGGGYKKVELLQRVINPLPWKQRLELNTHNFILQQGMTHKDTYKLQVYIDWALKEMRHTPRISLYNNVILSLTHIRKHDEAEQIHREAQTTYPLHDDWGKRIYVEIGN